MTPVCIARDHPNTAPSQNIPEMCASCYVRLPEATKEAYRSGRLKVRRIGAIARERVASVRTIGGGRRR